MILFHYKIDISNISNLRIVSISIKSIIADIIYFDIPTSLDHIMVHCSFNK